MRRSQQTGAQRRVPDASRQLSLVDPPLAERSDEDLMAAYGLGVTSALAELYERYAKKLAGYLRVVLFTITPSDAEDLAAECFFTLLRKRGFDARKGAFRSWLFAIAANKKRDWVRRDNPTKKVAARMHAETSSGLSADVVAVRECLGRLPRLQREVVYLRYMEGCTGEETARILGVPVGTVGSRLNAAMKALQSMLSTQTTKKRGKAAGMSAAKELLTGPAQPTLSFSKEGASQ